jgi:hypothetical protein
MLQKALVFGLMVWCSFALAYHQLQAQAHYDLLDVDSLARYPLHQTPQWWLELGVGALAYTGDLSPTVQKWSNGFQVAAVRNAVDRRFVHRWGLGWGFVTGERFEPTNRFGTIDASEERVNTFFRSQIIHLHYELRVLLLHKPKWQVYFSQGLGLMQFTVKDENGNDLLPQRSTRASDEDYNTTSLMLPTGLGFSHIFANGYAVGFQGMWMHPMTDYLDNISALGSRSGNDNVWAARFYVLVPLKRKPSTALPQYRPGTRGEAQY